MGSVVCFYLLHFGGRHLGGQEAVALLESNTLAGHLVVGAEASRVGRLGGLTSRGLLLLIQKAEIMIASMKRCSFTHSSIIVSLNPPYSK